MILERSAYEVDTAREQEFWAVQRDWYWPPEIGDFFNHLVGYFETTERGARQIIHIYRYVSLGEWEGRYQALYKRFPPHLFGVVRTLLSVQENAFMAPAPLELPTLPDLDRPVGPPSGYAAYGQDPSTDLVVQETIVDFLPGGLFLHWDAIRELPESSAWLNHNLVGMFHSTTGRLHRKYQYRWFDSAEAARVHAASPDAAAREVELKSAELEVGRTVRYLKPAPFPWLRPLFQPMDWPRFEARDQSQRRIATY
jgi:hypothetical protein